MWRASERHPNARRACAAAALAVIASAAVPVNVSAEAASPHLLDGDVADAIVRLRGGACSGTPITGTVYVVTAAHCVLTESGDVTRRTIVRDNITYTAVAVLVDTDYHDHPTSELDAAVLVMEQVIPGPAARIGSTLPVSGQVTLAGFQPIDEDGTLLRDPRRIGHHMADDDAQTRNDTSYRPAGCVDSAASLDVSDVRVMVPCGLVPGASGGGLFTENDGELVLVGIVSTVTADLRANGVVPMTALHELLDHPDLYRHEFSTQHMHREQVPADRP